MVKIIETVRDGFQGLKVEIHTAKKTAYINELLKVGFDAIDIGSFVSEKSVPQMADTARVIRELELTGSVSKLMVLVANKKGAENAVSFPEIDQLIYPFSISETFLKKNINADFHKAENQLDDILNISQKNNKELVVYLAMGFGNPYGDKWNLEIIHHWIKKLVNKGIRIIPLSDITGESTPQKIKEVYTAVISAFPDIEFGFHLHTTNDSWYEKVNTAYKAGCRRFDSVLGGLGGCPMTGYELLANLATKNLLSYFADHQIETNINHDQLSVCQDFVTHLSRQWSK